MMNSVIVVHELEHDVGYEFDFKIWRMSPWMTRHLCLNRFSLDNWAERPCWLDGLVKLDRKATQSEPSSPSGISAQIYSSDWPKT
jgi:hypothetical protein